MKLLIINGNIVARVSDSYQPKNDELLIDEPEDFDFDRADIYTYDGQSLSRKVPEAVTMRQARLALVASGLYSLVEAAINNIEDSNQRLLAQIEWEYATEVKRNSQLVLNLLPALDLTVEQVDALFIAASDIPK